MDYAGDIDPVMKFLYMWALSGNKLKDALKPDAFWEAGHYLGTDYIFTRRGDSVRNLIRNVNYFLNKYLVKE